MNFVENIEKSAKIFSKYYTSFDAACENAKLWTKCGCCKSFMKIIASYHKLVCDKCELTYQLPKKSKYKSCEGLKCTKDNFELFYVCKIDEQLCELSYMMCPKCFHENTYGPCLKAEKPKEGAVESYNKLYQGMDRVNMNRACDLCKKGKMMLVSGGNKSFFMICNDLDSCFNTIKIGTQIKACQKQKSTCGKCSANNLKIMFDPKHEIAPGFNFTGCVLCDEDYKSKYVTQIGKNCWREASTI